MAEKFGSGAIQTGFVRGLDELGQATKAFPDGIGPSSAMAGDKTLDLTSDHWMTFDKLEPTNEPQPEKEKDRGMDI